MLILVGLDFISQTIKKITTFRLAFSLITLKNNYTSVVTFFNMAKTCKTTAIFEKVATVYECLQGRSDHVKTIND